MKSSSPKGNYVFWRVAGVLTLLCLLWLVTSYPMGGLIHGLLAFVIAVSLLGLLRRRPNTTKANRGSRQECPPAVIDPDDLARLEGEGGLQAREPDRGAPHERLSVWTSPKPVKPGIETING